MNHLTLIVSEGTPLVSHDDIVRYTSFQRSVVGCGVDSLTKHWPRYTGKPFSVDGIKAFDFSDEAVVALPSIKDPDIDKLQSEHAGTFCVRDGVIAFIAPDNKKYVVRESTDVLRVLITHRYCEGDFNVPLSLNSIAFACATGENTISDPNLILQSLEALGNKRAIESHSRGNGWLLEQIRTDLDTALMYA